jgi:hypothetical protein
MIAEGTRDHCAGMKRLTTEPGWCTHKADGGYVRAPLAPTVGMRIRVSDAGRVGRNVCGIVATYLLVGA